MKKNFFSKILQSGIRKVLRNPKYRWLAIIAGLLYFFSPIDIIPDGIPLLGWLDDGILVSFVVAEVSQIMREQIQNRRKNYSRQAETNPVASTPVKHVIDVDAVIVK